MGRCIADCTKDRLVLNKADTEKYRLQHKNKKGLIVAQTRSNAFVTDMIYIALSAKKHTQYGWIYVQMSYEVFLCQSSLWLVF